MPIPHVCHSVRHAAAGEAHRSSDRAAIDPRPGPSIQIGYRDWIGEVRLVLSAGGPHRAWIAVRDASANVQAPSGHMRMLDWTVDRVSVKLHAIYHPISQLFQVN